MYNQKPERTEGDIFIEEFLKYRSIKFNVEEKIDNLKGDNKIYRVADFYIPKYKVYIEFLGRWNAGEEAKEKYKDKMRVYTKNRIPCIYIFPENLGIMDFTFNYRLRKTLNEYNLRRELFKFNTELFLEDHLGDMLGFLLAIVLLIVFQFDREAGLFWQSCLVVTLWAIYKFYKILDRKSVV